MYKIREIKAYYLGVYYYPHSQTQVGAHLKEWDWKGDQRLMLLDLR